MRFDLPFTLRPDNLTPARRTPWGGRRIPDHYKNHLGPQPTGPVGESWELSVEPDFPSAIDGCDLSLPQAIAAHPVDIVGPDRASAWGSTALLIKLLDAATPLSVQIHPRDDDPALDPDEGGKPESWFILDALPGAGLYLGLAPGVDRDQMARAIAQGDDVSALLNFVEVQSGDFFVIDAGTPHAIGAGLTLVEPQRVSPGKRGLTYRYWDWNRRYDPQGRPEPQGLPRPLHVDRALDVTDWTRPRGAPWLDTIRVRSGPQSPSSPARRSPLTAPLGFDLIRVERLDGTGALSLPPLARLRSLTVVAGEASLSAPGMPPLNLSRGQTAALPAASPLLQIDLRRALALLCWIP